MYCVFLLINTAPLFKGERNKYELWTKSFDKVYSLMDKSDHYAIRAAAQTSQDYVAQSVQQY